MDSHRAAREAHGEDKVLETGCATASVPGVERFEVWRERYRRAPGALDISGDRPGNHHAHERMLVLGPVSVVVKAMASTWLYRSRALADQADPGFYQLIIPRQGTAHIEWAGRRSIVGAGELCGYDLPRLRRAVLRAPHDGGLFESVILTVPGTALTLPPHRVDQVLGRPLPAGTGVGALLTSFATGLAADAPSLRATDGPRLGTVLLDLISALFANALDTELPAPPDQHRHALILRIRAFIRSRLHDPHLNPRTIAAAHHVSTSYLHRLFQEQDTSVAAWIRDQRLEHARRDLADPALADVPIQRIAARWGFAHAAAFSRAFRAAYGTPPRDFRERARRDPARTRGAAGRLRLTRGPIPD
ncbi:helix-turn-helix domain-containing protein [Marinactinospora rubrisoli]|uniref:Helix-turn-helix domain-containing protein n=1 Tax=Marinactinospora rubrisoli TaxID=2715399 RepID=A0ABW2KDX7_9ACTN